GGDGTGRPPGAADLYSVEPVYALDGIEPGPSHRGDQVAAELFIPGGASGRERPATHGETGGDNGLVAGVKGLLRKAADVVGRNCAAVGSPRQLSPPARPPNHR